MCGGVSLKQASRCADAHQWISDGTNFFPKMTLLSVYICEISESFMKEMCINAKTQYRITILWALHRIHSKLRIGLPPQPNLKHHKQAQNIRKTT